MPDWTRRQLTPHLSSLQLSPAREAEIIEELSSHLDDRFEELVAGGASTGRRAPPRARDLRDDADRRAPRAAAAGARAEPPRPRRAATPALVADLWQDLRLRRAHAARAARLHRRGRAHARARHRRQHRDLQPRQRRRCFERLPVREPEHARLRLQRPDRRHRVLVSWIRRAARRNDVVRRRRGVGTDSRRASTPTARPISSPALIVTGNFFDLLGVPAAPAATLALEDDVTPGAHPVAVISHGLWQRRFGGASGHRRPGRSLLNGQPFTIVGVRRADFRGPQVGIDARSLRADDDAGGDAAAARRLFGRDESRSAEASAATPGSSRSAG